MPRPDLNGAGSDLGEKKKKNSLDLSRPKYSILLSLILFEYSIIILGRITIVSDQSTLTNRSVKFSNIKLMLDRVGFGSK